MANILLTSIGTGRYDKQSREKQYNTALYGDSKTGRQLESAYIYDALIAFRNIEKIIFIGTTGSNWFLMYEHLYEKESQLKPSLPHDSDYALELLELFENPACSGMPLSEVRTTLNKLKDTLGDACLEIVLLHYGLNDTEISENFSALAQSAVWIQEGDVLSFDITHSFRSLAFYELLAVQYFQNMLAKKACIQFVSYGMFEYAKENNGVTPVTDQSKLLNLLDWTKAAEEYQRFGTTYLLCDLLENSNTGFPLSREETKALRRLSDPVCINDFEKFKQMVNTCTKIMRHAEKKQTVNPVMHYIFEDIHSRFGDALEDEMLLSARLSKWHLEKKRYIACVITAIESIITYCIKLSRLSKKTVRDRIWKIHSVNSDIVDFVDTYNAIWDLRNSLCHGTPLTSEELADLEIHLTALISTYTNHFQKNSQNEADLAAAFAAF